MAVIQNSFTGNGSTTTYSFTFPYLKTADIKASLDSIVTTAFTLPTATTLQFNTAPANGAKILIYRETEADALTATFYAGSAIKSEDLNDNFTQNLYGVQEVTGRYLPDTGGTLTGDIIMGEDAVIKFEGATDNAHETTLTVTDPTADRTITFPNVTGTVVTTGDTGTVTSAMIADSTIVNGDIANTTITGGKLVNDTITATQIAANAVTASELANDAVDTAAIVNDAVTGAKIANDSIDSEHYVDGSIDNAHLAAGAVTSVKLQGDVVTSDKIADNAVNSEHYVDGSIDPAHLANNAVETAKIADTAVTEAKLASNSVTLAKMADNSVGTSELVNDSVTTAKIANSAITAAKLAGDTITGAKIANDAIDSEHYVDGSIDTAHIADSQVTTAKLANAAVTVDKISTGAVTTVKIAADAIDGTKIGNDSLNSEHYSAGSIDTEHIADSQITTAKIAANAVTTAKIPDNAVTVSKIADAELTTLAGMQTDTASILAGSTALTSTLSELNMLDGKSIVTTISASPTDAQLPTAQAVDERITTVVTDVGGFVPIANETSFPSTNPDIDNGAGTIVSIKALSSAIVCGSGVTTKTIANGAGSGNTVTINGLAQNTTYPAGRGMLVETTSTLHTYTYHRLTLDESGVADAQSAIDDFNARYRIHAGEPTGSLDDGDLCWDTNANKMKVYDSTASAWKEVTSSGDFKFLIAVDAGTTTAATFDGSDTSFDLKEGTNTGSAASITSIYQLIISLNGVIQKPNIGSYSASEEGFYLTDSDTIRFCTAPPTGSTVFILQIGSATTPTTPADNTVSTVKIQNGAVTTAKMASDAITGDKIADDAVGAEHIEDLDANVKWVDNSKAVFGTGSDFEIYHNGTDNYLVSGTGLIRIRHSNEDAIITNANGSVELYHNNVKKFETTSVGVTITGNIFFADDYGCQFGNAAGSADLVIYHNGTNSLIQNSTGYLGIQSDTLYLQDKTNGHAMITAVADGAVGLRYDNVEKLVTQSGGVRVFGDLENHNDDFVAKDNCKFLAGNSGDLEIYHNGSHSFVTNSTGDLVLGYSNIYLQPVSGENGVRIVANGTAELYYDNVKKLETTANGCRLADGVLMEFGDSGEFTIDHGANTNTHLKHTGAGDMYIQSVNDILLRNNTSSDKYIHCKEDAQVELYYNNTRTLFTDPNGAVVMGPENQSGNLYIYGDEGDDNNDKWVFIAGNNEFSLQNYAGGSWENNIKCSGGGAVELYYDNTKTFSTDSYGCKVWRGPTHADAYLHITGGEGGHAIIEFHADEGDDNNDNWQLRAVDGGDFTLRAHANGSWQNVWKCLTIDEQHGMYMGNLGYGLEGNLDPSGTGNWTSIGCDGQFTRINGQAYVSVDDHLRVRDLDGSNDAERLRFDFQTNSGNAGAQNDWQDDQFDFAEMFEWSDGNPDNEDRIGHTVAVDGLTGKIKIAESGDTVIGVVSGTAAFTANCAGLGWHGQYERDEWGRYIWVEKTRIDGTKGTQFKVNSAFDATKEYVKREDRKEWDKIGIIGQCYVRKAAVIPSSWIKLKEIDSTKDFYLIK